MGTAGLSFLRGTEPVIATEMMQGSVMIVVPLNEVCWSASAAMWAITRALLLRLFHPAGDQHGQQAADGQIRCNRMPRAAGETHQRHRDERREPAADHARHLITDACAAVSILGA